MAPIETASTLPASWYTDPARLPLEMQHAFRRTWQFAAPLEQLQKPGDYLAIELLEQIPLLLLRDQEGALRAFYNVCRHRAGRLASGAGSRRALQCQYHGWTYGLDGRLRTTPELDGIQDFDKDAFCLAPVQVETWGPFAFVNLDPHAPPLAEWLGRIPDETAGLNLAGMRRVERRDYLVNANWKVYIDNYLEGYHVPMVHPGLFRELDYEKYRVDTFRYYSSQYAPIRPWRPGDERVRVYTQDGDDQALYYWIFPNFMLNIYMGSLQINVIVPRGHAQTLTIFEWYYPPDAGAAEMQKLRESIAFSDQIQAEDIQVCEDVWRGLNSGVYDRGRYAPRKENGVYHFHQLLQEFVGELS